MFGIRLCLQLCLLQSKNSHCSLFQLYKYNSGCYQLIYNIQVLHKRKPRDLSYMHMLESSRLILIYLHQYIFIMLTFQ